MQTEFRKAVLPAELRSLVEFDRRVFPKTDRFPASYWKETESYWMLVEGRKVGCCAFVRDVDFLVDAPGGFDTPSRKGSLYIATSGILPEFQSRGFGRLLKAWEIAFARHHGFERIVTNTRRGNARMIAINKLFGFRTIRTARGYYAGPVDATVVMELVLDR